MSHKHDATGDPLASCPCNLVQEGDVPPPEKKCTKGTDEEGNIRLSRDICIPSTIEVLDIEKMIDHGGYMRLFPTEVKMF
jgi:hypothetical protein